MKCFHPFWTIAVIELEMCKFSIWSAKPRKVSGILLLCSRPDRVCLCPSPETSVPCLPPLWTVSVGLFAPWLHVFLWSSDNKSAVVDEGNHRIRNGTAGFSSRCTVVNSSSLCSQHGGWKRRSPVNSPSNELNTPIYWLPKQQLSQTVLHSSEHCFWVCIRGTLSVDHPNTSPTGSPLFSLEVTPSILQNALSLASQLLQLLHFTSWLVSLSNPIPRSFFLTQPSPSLSHLCSGKPDKWSEPNLLMSLCGSPGLWATLTGCVVRLSE